MILTGKCEEEFEKWYKRKGFGNHVNFGMFLNMPLPFKYGVLVDFFDGFEIEIITRKNYWNVKTYPGHRHKGYSAFTKTRSEARTEAIKKANELFNEKFK